MRQQGRAHGAGMCQGSQGRAPRRPGEVWPEGGLPDCPCEAHCGEDRRISEEPAPRATVTEMQAARATQSDRIGQPARFLRVSAGAWEGFRGDSSGARPGGCFRGHAEGRAPLADKELGGVQHGSPQTSHQRQRARIGGSSRCRGSESRVQHRFRPHMPAKPHGARESRALLAEQKESRACGALEGRNPVT